MQTTLNEIKKYDPCHSSWTKGLKYLNKTKADDEPIDFMVIREAVGIEDAVLYLITQDYRNYCLFLTDVVESVLPVFEAKYPEDKLPRQTIKAIRDWYNGDITKEQLKVFAITVHTSFDYSDIFDAAAYAAYAATASITASIVINEFHDDAVTAVRAAAVAGADYANTSHWKEIDKLFIKHFS